VCVAARVSGSVRGDRARIDFDFIINYKTHLLIVAASITSSMPFSLQQLPGKFSKVRSKLFEIGRVISSKSFWIVNSIAS